MEDCFVFFFNVRLYCCKSFVALSCKIFLLFAVFALLSSEGRSDILNYSYVSNAGVAGRHQK